MNKRIDTYEERIQKIEDQIAKLRFCPHGRTEIRYRLASNSTKMYARQCLSCGEVLKTENGMWIKADKVLQKDKIKPIDDNMKRDRQDLIHTLTSALFEKKRMLMKEQLREGYHSYLDTPEWREKRKLVMERAGGLCEGCRKEKAEVVHHTTYEHAGDEFLFELLALCRVCHTRIHEKEEPQALTA